MKQLKIDMVSESEFSVKGHGVHTAYLELTNALKKRDDVEVYVNKDTHDTDITHIQTIGMYSLWKLLFGHGKKVVSAHVVPASFVGSIKGAEHWLPLSEMYLKWFYGRADMVFAVSNMVKTELEEIMKVPTRVEVLYNTVDMSQYRSTIEEKLAARAEHNLDEADFVVIGNGQVQPRKRFDTFVKAAQALPDIKFIWIGGIPFKQLGADYDKMNRLMKDIPDNMKVTGVIPLEQVRGYVQSANAFFLPAEQENHPLCVLEAAGGGLPIILRDIPEYDDTFRGDAIMIKKTREAVAAIERLRDDEVFYRQSVEAAGRIATRFDSEAGAELAVGFYRQLADNA
jgi:1,2-diacylglycerol-3-alpha-glucose alpha-1,2-galactosyltransferase